MVIPLSKIDIDNEIINAVTTTLKSGYFILGKETSDFEKQFADFCDVKYAACVSSGTAALFLSLKCLDIKNNDEVIIPSLSFFSTGSAVLMAGARPKFIEVDKKNYTLFPGDIEKHITKKTKAIIPVHLYGHPADMDEINEIAKKHALYVIEDSAQSHGAKYKNKQIGSLGDISCFSFYPSKNLTVCGDGGMIISNNKNIIDQAKILRNHGRSDKYIHKDLGYNLRFNEIQASIGKIMLKRLSKFNSQRRKIAKIYSDNILDVNVQKPIEEKWASHVYHMYTIRTKNRDKLKKYLASKNIETGIHYPIPIHRQPIMSKFYRNLPITDEISSTTLSLPMFPSFESKYQNLVIKKINEFFTR